ncbi:MAG: sigma-24 (FecI-like) [Candidatus Bipolaricaulis sibiricus]|uniref:Sigma-24 (FecI-like) n=1 Tax=Bipolaricaulis sibiricus TaxID=2501609 RepID=A0A410FVV8_BIPS1|nr:MAG: sigma-24 (FecI-like) [Candidatus Bipolaricaulis sibiricus]
MADEEQLVARVAEGDGDAFRTLYERYADRVFRYALTLLWDRHLAEDVMQETMVAAWKGAGQFEGRSRVSTWLFGIARHQAFRARRSDAKGQRVPEETDEVPDPAPLLEREMHVQRAVESLPPEQREVVYLAFYEGLPYEEIARVQGVPEGTVKSRMFHAKRKLAEVLRP